MCDKADANVKDSELKMLSCTVGRRSVPIIKDSILFAGRVPDDTLE